MEGEGGSDFSLFLMTLGAKKLTKEEKGREWSALMTSLMVRRERLISGSLPNGSQTSREEKLENLENLWSDVESDCST